MLSGFDQKSNIVLADSKERVYSLDEGVEEIPLGLYLVKGEMRRAQTFRSVASFSVAFLAVLLENWTKKLINRSIWRRYERSPCHQYAMANTLLPEDEERANTAIVQAIPSPSRTVPTASARTRILSPYRKFSGRENRDKPHPCKSCLL